MKREKGVSISDNRNALRQHDGCRRTIEDERRGCAGEREDAEEAG